MIKYAVFSQLSKKIDLERLLLVGPLGRHVVILGLLVNEILVGRLGLVVGDLGRVG